MTRDKLLEELIDLRNSDLDMLEGEFYRPSKKVLKNKILKEMNYVKYMSDVFIAKSISKVKLVELACYTQRLELYIKLKETSRNVLDLMTTITILGKSAYQEKGN